MEHLFYSAIKQQAHQEMQEKIASRKLKGPFYNFTFSKKEFESLIWHKSDIEFELDGHMYDILETFNKDDGSVTVKVVLDKKESLLLAQKGLENDLKLASQFAKIKLFNSRIFALSTKIVYLSVSFLNVSVPSCNGHLHLSTPPPDNFL